MSCEKNVLGALAVFAVLCAAKAAVFSPPFCATTCGPDDFIAPLSDFYTNSNGNRAAFWTTVALRQVEENVAELSPPAVARISGLVATCLYEAAAITTEELKSTLGSSYSFTVRGSEDALKATFDGAGFWAVREIFGQRDSFNDVFDLYSEVGDLDLRMLEEKMRPAHGLSFVAGIGSSRPSNLGGMTAAVIGAKACKVVVKQFTADGFEPDGTLGGRPDPTNYAPVNAPQKLAGITDCDNEIVDPGAWQPLCVPDSEKNVGTTNCTAQAFLAPFAGRFTTFALEDGDETTGDSLAGTPPAPDSIQFEKEWREVLGFSAKVDDVAKIIAEYWADGPDSNTPPGHWFRIAVEAALDEKLDAIETARLLFVVGNALNDAGIASWRVKFTYDFVRPLQMIQCGDYRGKIMTAWRGPYMGVGPSNISEWRPYQASNAPTPPFPGYVSGHSTFSSAAAEALKLYFGDDKYRGPPCFRTKEGESLFEPRSDDMPGLTDIPNTGPDSIGYVPGEDVVLCWRTYTDAAVQAGLSRILGGIHVRADDVQGREIGRMVGRNVFEKAQKLVLQYP